MKVWGNDRRILLYGLSGLFKNGEKKRDEVLEQKTRNL